jgi:hypothetical protein
VIAQGNTPGLLLLHSIEANAETSVTSVRILCAVRRFQHGVMTLRFTSMYATGRIAIFKNRFGTKARSRHVTAEFMNSGPREPPTLVVRAESFMSGCTFPSVLEIILQKLC